MAGNRLSHGSNSNYIHDNVARKPATNDRPVSQYTAEKITRRQLDRNVKIRRNQQKVLQFDGIYLLVLVMALICILYVCVSYLQIQSSLAIRMDHIMTTEQKLKTLKSQNDMLEMQINTTIDLDYVYRVATEELGMVYANKEQVLFYDKTESEYVRQYEDIPQR